MDAENSQIEAKPLIQTNFGDNGPSVSFVTIEEARKWVEREMKLWQKFWSQMGVGSVARNVLEHQLQLPMKIRDALDEAVQVAAGDRPKALEEIEALFERYADFGSLCSESPLGSKLLKAERHRHVWVKMGGLAGALGVPAEDIIDPGGADESQAPLILSGYAMGMARNFVKRSDIPDLQSRLDGEVSNMAAIVGQAEKERHEISTLGK